MERMPYQQALDVVLLIDAGIGDRSIVQSDWQRGLPTLAKDQVVLRELRVSDHDPARQAAGELEAHRAATADPARSVGEHRVQGDRRFQRRPAPRRTDDRAHRPRPVRRPEERARY